MEVVEENKHLSVHLDSRPGDSDAAEMKDRQTLLLEEAEVLQGFIQMFRSSTSLLRRVQSYLQSSAGGASENRNRLMEKTGSDLEMMEMMEKRRRLHE